MDIFSQRVLLSLAWKSQARKYFKWTVLNMEHCSDAIILETHQTISRSQSTLGLLGYTWWWTGGHVVSGNQSGSYLIDIVSIALKLALYTLNSSEFRLTKTDLSTILLKLQNFINGQVFATLKILFYILSIYFGD